MSPSKMLSSASPKGRVQASLNQQLDHKLLGYAAAASAAGIGMLALAQSSQAEIVYTPANQTISNGGSIAIDLNHDGITDFTIRGTYAACQSGPDCLFQAFYASQNAQNGVLGYGSFAKAVSLGQTVGPHQSFLADANMNRCKATQESYYDSGPWQTTSNHYLGLKFTIDGQIHYGWARLTVKIGRRCTHSTANLTGYAYETEPGKPILAGKRSGPEEQALPEDPQKSLGALALGLAGLVAWRREEETDGRGI
jgi:hypothetical protein